jgi:DegV family protein with EDD domain
MKSSPTVCIVTDSTAQFPNPLFKGSEHISVIPVRVLLNDHQMADGKDLKTACLTPSARSSPAPKVMSPTIDDFIHAFHSLEKKYQEIVVILTSSQLSASIEKASQAANSAHNSAAIHILDSQTTSVGLGLLVQMAAESAIRGLDGTSISRQILGMMPNVYTIFCIQSLTYLQHSGHLDPAQAIVGEMLGITPFFVLENGRLIAVQKIRNSRQLVDMLCDFLSEFDHLNHIALIHGAPFYDQEARLLRERITSSYISAQFSEHPLNIALASVLGPRALGIIAMENLE